MQPSGWPVIRQSHLIAAVGALLITVVVVGCAGVRSGGSQEEQGHTEATASEEARCKGTRTIESPKGASGGVFTTNDLPGCPKGGLLSGTNEDDNIDDDNIDGLYGGEGDDEIHGLGGVDAIFGGGGNDVIYGGPGDDGPLVGLEGDDVIYGGDGNDGDFMGFGGEDVLYGGDGNDFVDGRMDGGQRDELYCGEGRDVYLADKNDYVDSSCEKKPKRGRIVY